MQIHLVAGILAGSFAAIAPLEPGGRALILLCIALVVAAEAANTALEALVDLQGRVPSEGARIAKDAAAGAVLALAAASVVVFAIFAGGCWRALVSSWRPLLPAGGAATFLAAVTAGLLGRKAPTSAGTAVLATAGVLLVTLLAATAPCAVCATVPALLLGVGVDAARSPGGKRHP
jgi:diacylglycerol kinase